MASYNNGTEYTCSLWNNIIKVHWNYIETEESIKKLERRSNLECLLKEFLSLASQDRKFYLPETNDVLQQSVLEMDEFTAYKAALGFDAISQYANNLLAKPWRKEYRTIKVFIHNFYRCLPY